MTTTQTIKKLHVISSQKRMSVLEPEHHFCYDPAQVGYVVDICDYGIRYVTSYGSLGLKLGDTFELVKQTGMRDVLVGGARVIGIRDNSTGETEGEIPTRKLGHYAVK